MQIFGNCQFRCVHCTQIDFQLINARKEATIQVDREFQALSEYLLTFPKDYCSSHDPPKILIEKMERKMTVW